MLQCANISLSLGDRALLDDMSVIINPGDRIGLVGPNGAGKSTLLKVIMGLQEVDKGSVSMGKTESLGYLPQDGVEPNFSLNVVEEVESVFQGIFDLEKEVFCVFAAFPAFTFIPSTFLLLSLKKRTTLNQHSSSSVAPLSIVFNQL